MFCMDDGFLLGKCSYPPWSDLALSATFSGFASAGFVLTFFEVVFYSALMVVCFMFLVDCSAANVLFIRNTSIFPVLPCLWLSGY